MLGRLLMAALLVAACSDTNPVLEDMHDSAQDLDCTGSACMTPDAATANCADGLDGIGASDFTIRFRITTRATALSTVLFQRKTCDARNDLWSINLLADGRLRFELIQAGAQYTDVMLIGEVNDGKSHDAVIRREDLVLAATIDGATVGAAFVPQKLGQLSPLGIGSGNPCEAVDLKPLVGTVTDACLTRPHP